MSAITFDTLKYVENLVASGMPETQAKALAKAQTEVFDKQTEGLATKTDIMAVKTDIVELKADVREVEARLREVEARPKGDLSLVKWMLALVVVVTVVPTLKTLFG